MKCPLCEVGEELTLSSNGYYLDPHGRECILLYRETDEELMHDAEAWRVYVRHKAVQREERKRKKTDKERMGLK